MAGPNSPQPVCKSPLTASSCAPPPAKAALNSFPAIPAPAVPSGRVGSVPGDGHGQPFEAEARCERETAAAAHATDRRRWRQLSAAALGYGEGGGNTVRLHVPISGGVTGFRAGSEARLLLPWPRRSCQKDAWLAPPRLPQTRDAPRAHPSRHPVGNQLLRLLLIRPPRAGALLLPALPVSEKTARKRRKNFQNSMGRDDFH